MARLALALLGVLCACDPNPDVNGTSLSTTESAARDRVSSKEPIDDVDEPGPPSTEPTTTPDRVPTAPAEEPAPDPVPSTTATTPAPPPPAPKPIVSAVDVRWSRKTTTADYSFDIVTTGGKLIGPCIDTGTVGKNLSVRYSGVCTSPNIAVPIAEVAQVRVCWTEGGDWANATCAATPYDPTEDDVTIPN